MDKFDRKIVTYILGALLIINLSTFLFVKSMLGSMQEAHYTAMRQFNMLVLSVDSPEKLEALKTAIMESEFVKEEVDE